MKIRFLTAFLAVAAVFCGAGAQKLAVKTNILYDATATVNLGVEAKVAPQWTVDVSGNFNAWDISGHKWKHWALQPEARYWFCQAWSGHFVGAHLIAGQYNFGNLDMPFKFLGTDFRNLKNYRYQGWMGGLGIAYGYSWILDRHWNIEAEIGLGWLYTRYDRFECADCGRKVETKHPHNYVGPTKAALNLIYTF